MGETRIISDSESGNSGPGMEPAAFQQHFLLGGAVSPPVYSEIIE